MSGQMVPLGTLVDVRDSSGPVLIIRYNLYPAAPVMGGALPGLSSGQAIALLDRLARENLPRTMSTEWTELTFMQIKAGNTALYVFAGAVVFVFLVLAAQYESWTLPLAVILVVPMCLLCALAGVALRRLPMDIFVQIGFVVLVGLACKNAILIVEFAKQLRGEGKPRREATTEACRLRLRPDPDDVLRLHPGCGADGDRRGGGRRDARVAGHRRVQRHAGRDRCSASS